MTKCIRIIEGFCEEDDIWGGAGRWWPKDSTYVVGEDITPGEAHTLVKSLMAEYIDGS